MKAMKKKPNQKAQSKPKPQHCPSMVLRGGFYRMCVEPRGHESDHHWQHTKHDYWTSAEAA